MSVCWRGCRHGELEKDRSWKRNISGRSTPQGPPALPAMLRAQMCVELGILFRGDPKPEINQLMAK